MSSREDLTDFDDQSGPYDNKGSAPPDENTASNSGEEKREDFGMEHSTKEDPKARATRKMRKISFLRVMIMLYNFIFMVLSIIILSAGIYLLVSGNDVSFNISNVLSGSIIVILIGMVILGLSIMGLIAAIFPLHGLLWLYATLMFLVFVVEVAIGVFGFVVRDDITLNLREEFQFGIKTEFGNDNALYVNTITAIQDVFDCCGYYGYRDWDTSSYLNTTFSGQNFMLYPRSCCDNDFTTFQGQEYCNATLLVNLLVPGCNHQLNHSVDGLVIGIGIIGVGLALIQTLGILMALFLSCYKYKYKEMKLKKMPSFREVI